MDEPAVRQALIGTCQRLIAEWEARRDRRQRQWFDFDTSDIKIESGFIDYKSLATAWAYLDTFIDAMNHGFADLDGLPWDEAFSKLKEITRRLEQGLPVQDETGAAYLQANNRGCNPFSGLLRRSRQ